MNVLISVVSLLRNNSEKVSYSTPDEQKVEGYLTNEAAAKYLINSLKSKNQHLDKYIGICSGEVQQKIIKGEQKPYNQKTTATYFSELLTEYNEKSVEFIEVPYEEMLGALLGEIEKLENSYQDIHYFIDTTGGIRNTSFIIQLLFQFLSFKGVKIDRVLYSEYKAEGGSQVIDVRHNYDVLNVINAVSFFTETGKADLLKKCFEDFKSTKDNELFSVLFRAIDGFSKNMELCQTEQLEQKLKQLNEAFKQIEASQAYSGNSKFLLLKKSIPLMREKFFAENQEEQIDYIQLIDWCLGNGMLQQALTLYVEKIPNLIVGNLLEISESKIKSIKSSPQFSNKDFNCVAFYDNFLSSGKSRQELQYEIVLQYISNTSLDPIAYPTELFDNASIEKVKQVQKAIQELKRDFYMCGKLYDIIRSNTNTFEAMSKIIKNKANRAKLYEYIFGKEYKKLLSLEKKFLTAESLSQEAFWEQNSDYECNCKCEDMQLIAYHYIAVKYIRNQVHHASSEGSLNQEQKNQLHKMGCKIGDDFEYDCIMKCMKYFIRKLEEVVLERSVGK